jgi:hypothetical protein
VVAAFSRRASAEGCDAGCHYQPTLCDRSEAVYDYEGATLLRYL